MNIEDLILASVNAEHCQRNWDHSQSIPDEHVKALIEIATNMPTKANEPYYKLFVSTDRTVNRKFYKAAIDPNNPNTFVRNAQVDAQVVFTWFETKPHELDDDTNRLGHHDPWLLNSRTAMGISSGAVALAANTMGYRTGYNQCFNSDDIIDIVLEATGETDRTLFQKPHYQLGIGIPNSEHKWTTVLDDEGNVLENIKPHSKTISVNVV